jgi:hypothetical protein
MIYRVNKKQPNIDMESWAKKNNLNYQSKLKLSKFSLTFSYYVIIKDVIWGDFNNQRVYFFNIIRQDTGEPGEAINTFSFLNGNLFKELNIQDIEAILLGNQMDKKITDSSISDSKEELTEKVVAGIFLDNNIKLEHNFVKNIIKEIGWFKKSKLQELLIKKDEILKSVTNSLSDKIDYQTIINVFDQYLKVSGKK